MNNQAKSQEEALREFEAALKDIEREAHDLQDQISNRLTKEKILKVKNDIELS